MTRKPRHLSPEERALWDRVAERTTPLHPTRPELPEALDPSARPKTPPKPPLKRFKVGQAVTATTPPHDLSPSIEDDVAKSPVAMDKKRFGKMKKGKLTPEARIDLHGLTLAQAHPALVRFVLESVADGRRLVLVITGKGKARESTGPIPERLGVLRHQVPHWLNLPPLSSHVLQITESHLKHGGRGAYYVYLRRAR
ncbi:Smr/MutS family protein [Maritimibacter sp. DP1N21-5]|uniref:Smr/MutS family protein n=1 Tax=Maritimibacter sp. DP1N21-5 TaxID=2836867 RepID=UPI001C45964A|nr:Smr/MutS family protein [Maritimibacter sp. DP1N21-5]MBV7411028.1 Smr/MutS family protein [Maritimibacter sp. DP1N21-5]